MILPLNLYSLESCFSVISIEKSSLIGCIYTAQDIGGLRQDGYDQTVRVGVREALAAEQVGRIQRINFCFRILVSAVDHDHQTRVSARALVSQQCTGCRIAELQVTVRKRLLLGTDFAQLAVERQSSSWFSCPHG